MVRRRREPATIVLGAWGITWLGFAALGIATPVEMRANLAAAPFVLAAASLAIGVLAARSPAGLRGRLPRGHRHRLGRIHEMDALPHRLTALAALSFVAVALVQTWPLALHVPTHITGLPGGDAGVYLWNVWHFGHRLIDLAASPFWSDDILTVAGPANLALHNYTVFADLIAMPLQSVAGVVTSFNVVYLINVALSGLGMFLLAHRVTGRVAEAWLAGVMFAWAPFLVARGASHFSLAAAAPLPFFVYWLDRAWNEGRRRHAAAAGATVAWAFYCDPYYAVYTAMLLAIYVASRLVRIQRRDRTAGARRVVRVSRRREWRRSWRLFVAVHVVGGGAIAIGSLTIAMTTLYTPMLALAVLLLIRALLRWRVQRITSSCHLPMPSNSAACS